MADFKFLLDVIAKFAFSVKLITIACNYKLHVILHKYPVHLEFQLGREWTKFSVKLGEITYNFKLHVILRKYHVRFGILIWQDNGDATPAKFEFSLKLITITCNFQLQQRQSEVGNNHIQIQTACDPSQVSRAFLGRLTVYCISVNSDL